MARRADFGRAPRVAQSLTNTLVAIAREMQNRRDSNLIDAWKGGGMFEGQKATDELVLAHWKRRLEGISKDDPLWDTYNNAYMQYDYAINESKMSVLHAQGRISDTAAAQFYLNWAKKVPRNSEFWRVLQRDGAQMMQRARATADSGRRQREEDAYNAQQAALSEGEKPAQYLVDLMTTLARNGAFQTSNIVEGSGELSDFDITDPGMLVQLLQGVRPSANGQGASAAVTADKHVYFDDNNVSVTTDDIINDIRAFDPSFSGELTPDYIAGVIRQRNAVLDDKIALAESTGHITDASNYAKQRKANVQLGRQVAAYPAEQTYLELRAEFADAIGKPGVAPKDIVSAFTEYSSELMKLAKDPSLVGNDFFINRLQDEALGKGGETMYESFANTATVDATRGSPTSAYLQRVEVARNEVELAADPANALTQGKRLDDGTFVPQPGGQELGVASLQAIKDASPVAPHWVYVPTANGPQAVLAIGSNINATARDANGDTVKHAGSKTVGVMYQVPGLDPTMGFVPTEGGPMLFTQDIPYDMTRVRLVPATDGTGWTLDLTGVMPQPDANGRYGALPPGFKADAKSGYVVTFNTAALSSDPYRVAAGRNPMTDHSSLAVASLMNSTEGRAALEALRNDPNFQSLIEDDARRAAGFSPDPNAPDGSGWSGGNLAQYNMNVNVNRRAIESAVDGGDIVGRTSGLWNRETTEPLAKGAEVRQPAEDAFVTSPFEAKLPLDALTGTAWEALGSTTITGTNNLVGKHVDDVAFGIKVGKGITVPDIKDASSTIITPAAPAQTANSGALGAFIGGQTGPIPDQPSGNQGSGTYRGPGHRAS